MCCIGGPTQQGREPGLAGPGAEDLCPGRLDQLRHALLPRPAEQQQAQKRVPQVRLPEGARAAATDVRPHPPLPVQQQRQIVSKLKCTVTIQVLAFCPSLPGFSLVTEY